MSTITRRAALAGAGAALMGPEAMAALPATLRAHRGYQAWSPPGAGALPLDEKISTGAAEVSLREWLGGRPAVLGLWASWCGPCLSEKPNQAIMSRRLAGAGARARILVLQTYDDITLEQGRRVLSRLGASDLTNGRSTPNAEAAFMRLFGTSPVDPTRTSMPWLALIGSDGAELGRALGIMYAPDRHTDYWGDEATFDFLSRLT